MTPSRICRQRGEVSTHDSQHHVVRGALVTVAAFDWVHSELAPLFERARPSSMNLG